MSDQQVLGEIQLCKLERFKLQLEEVMVALEGFLVGFDYVGKQGGVEAENGTGSKAKLKKTIRSVFLLNEILFSK